MSSRRPTLARTTLARLLPLTAALGALSLCAFSSPAHADVWFEAGDAGQTLVTAQNTATGTNAPLTSISGSIVTTDDVDLFRIYVSDFTAFSATASGGVGDNQLFLFDSSGVGIAANDDAPFSFQAQLPVGDSRYAGRTAGYYYLGIAPTFTQANDANGDAVLVPFGQGVAGPGSTLH